MFFIMMCFVLLNNGCLIILENIVAFVILELPFCTVLVNMQYYSLLRCCKYNSVKLKQRNTSLSKRRFMSTSFRAVMEANM